jgi:hypothetical protein
MIENWQKVGFSLRSELTIAPKDETVIGDMASDASPASKEGSISGPPQNRC